MILHIKKYISKITVLIFSLIVSLNSSAASKADSLFRSDEVVRMELRSDFSAIQKDRDQNPEYHDGQLIYYTPSNEQVRLSVKVMVRGNFRLKPENCSFPPLLVNFRKNGTANTLFENQDKLKLVTPCQSEAYVIDEYTVYKLYNEVTDLSFKVRLAKILYFDTGRNKALFEAYSFFIEDKDHVAERNSLIAKDRFITPFDIDRDNYIKLSFFQYLIGNTDWWVSSRKNILLLQSRDSSSGPFAVPYDFDFSGFVNAAYTYPFRETGYSTDNRRVYKGICYTDAELKEVFEFYKGLRPVFESIINNQDLIPRYNRKEILRYLKGFYSVIDSKYLIKQNILDMCETRKDYNLTD